jgi:hemoglobin
MDQLGGEEKVRELVNRFYDLIETTPEGANIHRLHLKNHGMARAREEQFNFLCGFFAGRRHYEEKHGHMSVRMIHQHVPITQEDAHNWLACMKQAISDCGITGPLAEKLQKNFTNVALMLAGQSHLNGLT